jgi:hypothetical protein
VGTQAAPERSKKDILPMVLHNSGVTHDSEDEPEPEKMFFSTSREKLLVFPGFT